MQEFTEHWVQVRTPEQFSIFYQCCTEVAQAARARMAPSLESKVDGLAAFKANYTIPEINLEINNLRLILTGTSSDLYGLGMFLEDAKYFGFQMTDEGYVVNCANKKAVAEMQADLVELTETWGWQLNL